MQDADRSASESPRAAFALLIETAFEQFRLAKLLISNNIILSINAEKFDLDRNDMIFDRARISIIKSLCKNFLFNCVRARRVCEHAPDKIGLSRIDRIRFLKSMEAAVAVRDINEHGYDANGRKSSPKIHELPDAPIAADETSLVFHETGEIYLGPIELNSIFTEIERMRIIAGWRALREG